MFISLLLEDKIKTAVQEATKEVEIRYKGRSFIPEGILEQSIIKNYDTINFFQYPEIDPCVVELHEVKLTYLTLSGSEDIPKYKYKIGLAMAALGQPILKKRFVTPGASRGTSIASKYLSKAFPQTLSTKILGTKVVGRVLGRLVPIVGWGLIAIDAIEIMYDVLEIDKNKSIYGEGSFGGYGNDNYY